MGHILHFFAGVDLRCNHNGLSKVAELENVDVTRLQPGEYVIYLNAKRDRVKLFASSNIIAYLKLDVGTIDLRTIEHIPRVFESTGKIDYNQALDAALRQSLVKKRKIGPLEAAAELKKVKELGEMTPEEARALAGELVLTDEEEMEAPAPKKRVILRKTGEREEVPDESQDDFFKK